MTREKVFLVANNVNIKHTLRIQDKQGKTGH